MPDKFENGTLPMKTKQKFSVHTWKRIKCSASGAHMSFCLRPHYKDQRRQKRLNAPLSMHISRHWAFQPTSPYSRHIWTLLFTRKRLLSFLIYLACQALRIILRKKKKTEYFSWSDDEVKLLLNVTGDYKTSKAFDFSHTCYKVRYLTPST